MPVKTQNLTSQRIVLGIITDSSNPQTKGELNPEQTQFLGYLQSEVGYEVVLQKASHQDKTIRTEGLAGPKVISLLLELFSRQQNLTHTARFKKANTKQRFSARSIEMMRTFLPPVLKFARADYRHQLTRLKAIETVVSDKHIYLWTSIVETSAVGGIIFESDFVPGPKIGWGRLSSAVTAQAHQYDYIDFSGSFTLEKLGLEPSEDGLSVDFLTTNTLCAYWISREAASAALSLVARRPWLRAIGADFLLNSVNGVGGPWRSFLVSKPVVGHRSMTNRSKTTIGTI